MIDRKEMMKHKRKNVSVHLIKLLKRIDNYDNRRYIATKKPW